MVIFLGAVTSLSCVRAVNGFCPVIAGAVNILGGVADVSATRVAVAVVVEAAEGLSASAAIVGVSMASALATQSPYGLKSRIVIQSLALHLD